MLQRVQTLYLLGITILSLICLFSPVAGLNATETAKIYALNYNGLFEVSDSGNHFMAGNWVLTAISVMMPVLSFIAILLFKRRILQIRVAIFNIVLMAGFYGLLFIYLWQFGKSLEAKWFLEIVAAFPLVNIVLSVLAIRAIGRDEALIKSLNRIR